MINIIIPEVSLVKEENQLIAAKAGSLSIVSKDEYLQAGEYFKSIKVAQKKVKELFKDSKDQANKAHKSICEIERTLLSPLEDAEKTCGMKITVYTNEQRRLQEIEAQKLRKEAEERSRIESELLKKKQDEERLNLAQQLESSGFKKEAEEIIAQDLPAPIAPVIIEKSQIETAKIDGVHTRANYKFVVDDLMLIVQEVAAGRAPLSYLLPNDKVLNQQAKSLKHEFKILGGHVVEETSVVGRV